VSNELDRWMAAVLDEPFFATKHTMHRRFMVLADCGSETILQRNNLYYQHMQYTL